MPDPEVVACPACRHAVRVPADWLGTTVRCPECRAAFTAPVREGDRLTEAVLLSAPPPAAPPPAAGIDPYLLLPGFGLLLTGIASLVVNGYFVWAFFATPDAGRDWMKRIIVAYRDAGVVLPGCDDPATDDANATKFAGTIRVIFPVAAAFAALSAAGGVALIRRRGYRLAQLGCLAAALNLPHGCCLPGAVFGLWGGLMLMGTDRFRPPSAPPV